MLNGIINLCLQADLNDRHDDAEGLLARQRSHRDQQQNTTPVKSAKNAETVLKGKQSARVFCGQPFDILQALPALIGQHLRGVQEH